VTSPPFASSLCVDEDRVSEDGVFALPQAPRINPALKVPTPTSKFLLFESMIAPSQQFQFLRSGVNLIGTTA
jgi:hypothetical protein